MKYEKIVKIVKSVPARLDDPISLSEAALMLYGVSDTRALVRVSRLIERGLLTEYRALGKRRNAARRVSRAEVASVLRRWQAT